MGTERVSRLGLWSALSLVGATEPQNEQVRRRSWESTDDHMEAFEKLVSEILWMEGFWVRTAVKVDLSDEKKHRIRLPSAPRCELDIVAHSGRDDLQKVFEFKGFLDSRGVMLHAFDVIHKGDADRYKLFNQPDLIPIRSNGAARMGGLALSSRGEDHVKSSS